MYLHIKTLTGPTGKRMTGYAVMNDETEVQRFMLRQYGYWRFAQNAARNLINTLEAQA